MEQQSSYAPLRPSSEGPNPLRPYYRPPTIGVPSSDPTNTSSSAPAHSSSTNFGTSARDILSDLNYNDLLGESGATGGFSFKAVLDSLVWRYSSVLMAQPFEVAKTVLQVRMAPSLKEMRREGSKMSTSRKRQKRAYGTDNEERYRSDYQTSPNASEENASVSSSEDEDDAAPSYFTSTTPSNSSQYNPPTPKKRRHQRHSQHQPPRQHRRQSSSTSSPPPPHQTHPWRLTLTKPSSLLEVLSQLWSHEGAWGTFKGANITFIYGLLLKTLETWTRSMLSALVNLPDAGAPIGSPASVGGLDVVDSPSPVLSLVAAVVAAGLAGVVLAPLDMARTRLLLTPTSHPPRSLLPTLRLLPSYLCPSSLLAPTLLNSTLPTLLSTSTPLLLRNYLRIDPILTPTSYGAATFVSHAAELFLRLPFETVLRRGQMAEVLAQARRVSARRSRSRGRSRGDSSSDRDATAPSSKPEELKTIVEIGPYTGVIASMYNIATSEGERAEKVEMRVSAGQAKTQGQPKQTMTRAKKGQGVHGLWRGWRVGWWGLVGVWGAAALGGAGGKGGEF